MPKCRICGSQDYIELLSNLKSKFSLKRCRKCSFVYTDPLPTAGELKILYDLAYWQKNQGITGRMLNLFYRFRMSGVVKDIKKMIPAKGRILDWGAGDGSLVKVLARRGFDCLGIDLYRNEPEDKRIINTTIEKANFPDQYFDAITCFHVLEHLENPSVAFQKALKLLKDGGFLIIEVPNISSFGFKIFKKRWQPLEIPIHLNHFNLKSLEKMFELAKTRNIVKVSFFSPRVSTSALVLSLFPFFSPRKIRQKYNNRYPLFFMFIYLILQIFAYPFVLIEPFFKNGEVVRIIIKK